MDKKARHTENAMAIVLLALVFGAFLSFIIFILVPLAHQAEAWLKTGALPPRDLYWFTADVRCAATGWRPLGFEGMDLCRPNYIHFTHWVGVDRIMNFLFDVHIAILALVGFILSMRPFFRFYLHVIDKVEGARR